MNLKTIPPDAVWNAIIGAILLLVGARGKGYIRLGGLRAGRRFDVGASKAGRIIAATLGALLVFVAIVEFLGREETFGITWVKHLVMTPIAGDAVLILVGLSSLAAALSARSYSRDAAELVHVISAERVVFWVRILCLSISVICLGSGVWGLTHHL